MNLWACGSPAVNLEESRGPPSLPPPPFFFKGGMTVYLILGELSTHYAWVKLADNIALLYLIMCFDGSIGVCLCMQPLLLKFISVLTGPAQYSYPNSSVQHFQLMCSDRRLILFR